MRTFDILGRYFLFLLLFGVGLYLVMVAFIPSWRKKKSIHLEIYLGHGRSKTAIEEWDLNERKSASLNAIVGVLLMLGGIAGIVWTWHLR